jgi:hypothetical protein
LADVCAAVGASERTFREGEEHPGAYPLPHFSEDAPCPPCARSRSLRDNCNAHCDRLRLLGVGSLLGCLPAIVRRDPVGLFATATR